MKISIVFLLVAFLLVLAKAHPVSNKSIQPGIPTSLLEEEDQQSIQDEQDLDPLTREKRHKAITFSFQSPRIGFGKFGGGSYGAYSGGYSGYYPSGHNNYGYYPSGYNSYGHYPSVQSTYVYYPSGNSNYGVYPNGHNGLSGYNQYIYSGSGYNSYSHNGGYGHGNFYG